MKRAIFPILLIITLVILAPVTALTDYQLFKYWVIDIFQISKDAIHMYVGFISWLTSLIVLRYTPSDTRSLLLGFGLSLAMELSDLRGDYLTRGILDISGSIHDLVNTNMIPAMLVLFFQSGLIALNQSGSKASSSKS